MKSRVFCRKSADGKKATQECPCGYHGDLSRRCICPPPRVQKYISKLSGPLLDRIDLHIEVPSVPYDEMTSDRTGEKSEVIRKRVADCREIQRDRFRARGVHCNARMHPADMDEFTRLSDGGRRLLRSAIEKLGLSARAYDRILRVSRTIADLARTETIQEEHICEAIQYRSLDRKMFGYEQEAAA